MRRSVRWAAMGILGLGPAAQCQLLPTYQGMVASFHDRPVNPLEPLPSSQGIRSGGLPAPVGNSEDLEIIRGDNYRRDGDRVFLDGGVEFLYKGYRTLADRAEGDLTTEIFTLYGHVKVIGTDATTVEGVTMEIDYLNRTFRATDSRAILPPSFIANRAKSPVYTFGGTTYGNERRVYGIDSKFTTCEYENPHFDLEAASTDYRPGKRIIFREARIQLFGHTILSLPYLSIPLDSRRPKYFPEFGYSADEGYFVKSRYGIPLKDGSVFDSRLDLMSKLGVGFGGDYAYQKELYTGTASLYKIIGKSDAIVLNNTHEQQFKWGTLGIDNSYQKDYYLTSPDSTLISTRIQATIPQGRAATNLSYNRYSSDFSGSNSVNQTFSVNDNRTIGKFQTNFDITYQDNFNHYPGSTDYSQKSIDFRARGTQDLKEANLAVEYTRSIPVGDTANFYSGGDKTPVVTLSSDALRLFGPKAAQNFGLRTNLSVGEFGDLQDNRVQRYEFDADLNKPDRSDHRFKADYQASFKQGMYSDDTAQYTVGGGMNLSYRLGTNTAANIRYQYLRPEGYSPVSIDRTGNYHLATTDISVRPQKYVLLAVQAGYDFNRLKTGDEAWQQLGLRAEFNPARYFGLRALATYDTISKLWSGVRIDTTYIPGATFLSVGARYDGIRGAWSNLDLFLNSLKVGRSRLSASASYNGFTKQLDGYQVNAIYDLHCADAIVTFSEFRTGFRPGREISFFIRLKAFPTDTLFGIGRQGQPLGPTVGRDF